LGDEDFTELAVVIPREIERVEEKKSALETELEAMKNLLQIVGQDMLAGISDE
jgi:hypothetical protein